jgi:hypothetical protein
MMRLKNDLSTDKLVLFRKRNSALHLARKDSPGASFVETGAPKVLATQNFPTTYSGGELKRGFHPIVPDRPEMLACFPQRLCDICPCVGTRDRAIIVEAATVFQAWRGCRFGKL